MVNDINLRKTNYLVFISFFPVFIFRSNLNINEIIYTLLIFIGPILLMNYLIFKKKLLNRFFFISYSSSNNGNPHEKPIGPMGEK